MTPLGRDAELLDYAIPLRRPLLFKYLDGAVRWPCALSSHPAAAMDAPQAHGINVAGALGSLRGGSTSDPQWANAVAGEPGLVADHRCSHAGQANTTTPGRRWRPSLTHRCPAGAAQSIIQS